MKVWYISKLWRNTRARFARKVTMRRAHLLNAA